MAKILIIDGYNVLRSSGIYSHIMVDDFGGEALNAARETLIADVGAFAGREYQATIVFDGGGNPESRGEPQKVGNLTVIFSPAGKSADSVIEKLARTHNEAGDEVLVVTSDAATQFTVLRTGVTRMSAQGFAEEMRGVRASVDRHNPSPKVKNTLADRLDEKTRKALEALRG